LRTPLSLVVIGLSVILSGCSNVCDAVGPVQGWNPETLGLETLPSEFEAVEHHQAPDPTGNQCQTYVFLSSGEDVKSAETILRAHFEAQGMQVRDGESERTLFSFSGSTSVANLAVWVRPFEEFSTLTSGIDIDHLRDRDDIVVVLSIGSWR